MKKETFSCNLCRTEKDKKELKSFYFKCDIIPQQFVIHNDISVSDVHICSNCLIVIEKYILTKTQLSQ